VTISAAPYPTLFSLFGVSATGNFTMRNLTLANAKRGIFVNAGQATVVNSDFHGFDGDRGSAINNSNGTLTVIGSVFYDNHSSIDAAAIYSLGVNHHDHIHAQYSDLGTGAS
jgi:hypothetical protein